MHPFPCQVHNFIFQIVTHQKNFVPVVLLRRMKCQLGRRECEDKPSGPGIHRAQTKDVPEERAVGGSVLAVYNDMRSDGHRWHFPLRSSHIRGDFETGLAAFKKGFIGDRRPRLEIELGSSSSLFILLEANARDAQENQSESKQCSPVIQGRSTACADDRERKLAEMIGRQGGCNLLQYLWQHIDGDP